MTGILTTVTGILDTETDIPATVTVILHIMTGLLDRYPERCNGHRDRYFEHRILNTLTRILDNVSEIKITGAC